MARRGGLVRSSADDRGDATQGGGMAAWPAGAESTRATTAHPLALQLCLMRMLDEIDYGLILLDNTLKVWHVNHLARLELARGQVLHVEGGQLRTRVPGRLVPLQAALHRAAQGIRSLLDLAGKAFCLFQSAEPGQDRRIQQTLFHPGERQRGCRIDGMLVVPVLQGRGALLAQGDPAAPGLHRRPAPVPVQTEPGLGGLDPAEVLEAGMQVALVVMDPGGTEVDQRRAQTGRGMAGKL